MPRCLVGGFCRWAVAGKPVERMRQGRAGQGRAWVAKSLSPRQHTKKSICQIFLALAQERCRLLVLSRWLEEARKVVRIKQRQESSCGHNQVSGSTFTGPHLQVTCRSCCCGAQTPSAWSLTIKGLWRGSLPELGCCCPAEGKKTEEMNKIKPHILLRGFSLSHNFSFVCFVQP